MKPLDVTILLLNDCYASTALAPIEIFHSAGRLWNTLTDGPTEPRFQVTPASLDHSVVETPYSIRLLAAVTLDQVGDTDIIIVPASGLNLEAQVARHRALLPWLRDRHERGAYIASVCSGAAYLAEAGLLDGREATTHWAVADAYMQRYPKAKWRPDAVVTEDRRVLCSGGVYAAVDLSLYLVDKFCGHDIAVQTAKALLVDMPRTHQSGYAVLPLSRPHTDQQIRDTETFMQQNYARDLSIENLAARVHMSPRTFIRRFKLATGHLPGKYMQALRVSIAKAMLEEGARSIQTVSASVGYEDAAYFRALFKRLTGMTPAQYRTKFTGVRSREPAAAGVAPPPAPN